MARVLLLPFITTHYYLDTCGPCNNSHYLGHVKMFMMVMMMMCAPSGRTFPQNIVEVIARSLDIFNMRLSVIGLICSYMTTGKLIPTAASVTLVRHHIRL